MPPLPPKPKVPPVAQQALVIAVLATTACRSRVHVRIGQPPRPPYDLARECMPALITDDQGNPLAGTIIHLYDGQELVSDAEGHVELYDEAYKAIIDHPGFEAVEMTLDCDGAVVRLRPIVPTESELVDEPVRIGPHPGNEG